MSSQESSLLWSALQYEEGHPRRTQHILKVSALTRLLGDEADLSPEEQRVLQAAAILHDIAIKYCKEHYDGDACQENQKKEAPRLVRLFLEDAGYPPEDVPAVVSLVISHHDYDRPRSRLLQLLIEADLIVNCYESAPAPEQLEYIGTIFETARGKALFCTYKQAAR